MIESELKNWWTVPDTPLIIRRAKLVVSDRGFAEIKPHTESGVRGGITQIQKRLARSRGYIAYLVTYYAVNERNQPIRKGRAKYLHVFAAPVTQASTPAQYRDPKVWRHLGYVEVPQTIPHPPVHQGGAFGWAVEEAVREKFKQMVKLETPHKKWTPATGGYQPGADIRWHELAELYAELARELRDPLYAELASELAAMAEAA